MAEENMAKKPTRDQLRALAKELGITAKTAGMGLDRLIAQAQKQEDPDAWLQVQAPPADEVSAGEVSPEAKARAKEKVSAALGENPDAEESKPDPEDDDQIPAPTLYSIANLVSIEIPLGEIPTDAGGEPTVNIPRRVEARLNGRAGSSAQRVILKRITIALNDADARLESGRHVESGPDAIRWLLEAIGAAATKKKENAGHGKETSEP